MKLPKVLSIVLCVAFAALCVVLTGQVSHAWSFTSNYYPKEDAGYDGGVASNYPWLVVGEATTTNRIETYVKLYFSSNSGNVVTVRGIDYCPSSSIDDRIRSDSWLPSGAVTQFSFVRGTTEMPYFNGYYSSNNQCNSATYMVDGVNRGTLAVAIPSSYFTYDAQLGLWWVGLKGDHIKKLSGTCSGTSNCDGIENYFRLGVNNGGLIAHAGGASGNNTSLNYKGSSDFYSNYSVRFGTDCTLTGAGTKSVTFYDLDNLAPGIQPSSLSVRIRDDTTGSFIALNGGSTTATPSSDDNRTVTVSFTATPGHKYTMMINNAYSNNLIQYSVPFDGIYYDKPCDGTPTVTHTAGISSSTITIGDPVTGTLSFTNNGQSTINTLNYQWELVAFDKNSNRVASLSRDWSISNLASKQTRDISDWTLSNWVTGLLQSGTRGPNYIGKDLNTLTYSTYKICSQTRDTGMTLSPSGKISPNFSQSCTTIAKTPALTVTDGDLRVGGSFTSNAGGVCTLPVAVVNNNNPYGIWTYEKYGTSRSSLGQYAATTPGLITGYGSKGVPYKSISGWNSLLFGTEGFPGYGYNGFFLGPLLTTGNIPALGTGTTSYCLPNTASMYTTTAGTQSIATSESVTNADLTSDASYRFTGNNATLNLSKQSGVVLDKGQRRIIKVTQPDSSTGNTIVIKGPITYTTTGYSSIVELPQFVLVADGKIDIQFDGNPAVPTFTIDGIISTKGNVYTCNTATGTALRGDESSSALTWSGQCSTQLVVNGAIIAAGRVLPYRTYGFDKSTDTSTYAEEFNLTADTLLGDYARTEGSGLTVDYQSELPARY